MPARKKSQKTKPVVMILALVLVFFCVILLLPFVLLSPILGKYWASSFFQTATTTAQYYVKGEFQGDLDKEKGWDKVARYYVYTKSYDRAVGYEFESNPQRGYMRQNEVFYVTEAERVDREGEEMIRFDVGFLCHHKAGNGVIYINAQEYQSGASVADSDWKEIQPEELETYCRADIDYIQFYK